MHNLHDSRTLPSGLKTKKAISLTGSDTSSGLIVSRIPESHKVEIFVLDRRRQTKTNYFWFSFTSTDRSL